MSNVFESEKTLGEELVRCHRSHAGQPVERFLKFILPKHLLELMEQEPGAEEPDSTETTPSSGEAETEK